MNPVPCYMFAIPIGALSPFKLVEEPWARQSVLDKLRAHGDLRRVPWGLPALPAGEDQLRSWFWHAVQDCAQDGGTITQERVSNDVIGIRTAQGLHCMTLTSLREHLGPSLPRPIFSMMRSLTGRDALFFALNRYADYLRAKKES